ncbi:glycosyltransferase family 2 protein [Vibrio gigantis]|uniref:glycosyltransferase family 2 protein n=1 Tax=Vibrio gigantis TaxID=296199 RepID=UPI003D0A6369
MIFSKEKTCAVIVTYNPELERLSENIEAIFSQVGMVILIDNNSININDIKAVITQFDEGLIEVLESTENLGIAFALNSALTYCKKNDFEFLITLDQDSISSKNMVDNLSVHLIQGEDIAMVGPQIIDINTERSQGNANKKPEDTMLLITSGALCKVDTLLSVGGFNNKLFIDCVDFDMSLKLYESGYKVLRANDVCMTHEIGHKTKISIFNVSFYLLNHSPLRVYYMVRNRIYLIFRYKHLRGYNRRKELRHLITRSLACLFFESERRKKMISTFRGVWDVLWNYDQIKK